MDPALPLAGHDARGVVHRDVVLLRVHDLDVPHQLAVPGEHARQRMRVREEAVDVRAVRRQRAALAPRGVHARGVVPRVERREVPRDLLAVFAHPDRCTTNTTTARGGRRVLLLRIAHDAVDVEMRDLDDLAQRAAPPAVEHLPGSGLRGALRVHGDAALGARVRWERGEWRVRGEQPGGARVEARGARALPERRAGEEEDGRFCGRCSCCFRWRWCCRR